MPQDQPTSGDFEQSTSSDRPAGGAGAEEPQTPAGRHTAAEEPAESADSAPQDTPARDTAAGGSATDRTDEPAADRAGESARDDGEVVDDEDADEDDRGPGCFKVGCLTLLTMLVISALAVGGFAAYLYYRFDNNVQHSKGLLPSSGGPTRNAAAGNAQNILLLGSDSRDTTSLRDNGRSDVIQLVHVADDRKSVQVVHFPRDMYVDIPGHGKNKINAAFAYGGVSLLVQTLQNMLGVRIDHVAVIGFTGFAKLTDTVGGVNIYVPQAYSELGFGTFNVGWHHMNGEQALGFVRERHQLQRGDVDRGVNQQAWIQAVMAKTIKAGTLLNPVKLSNVLDDLTGNKNFTVDDTWSSSAMLGLGMSLRDLKTGNITFYSAPITGFGTDPKAGSIDVVDETKLKQLGKALYDDDFSGYSGPQNHVN